MSMPTSIFNFIPSTLPKSISSAVSSALPGIPSLAGAQIASGLNNLIGQLGIPALGLLSFGDNSGSPLTQFLYDMQDRGIAWQNRFYVRIPPPPLILETIKRFGTRGPEVIDPERLTLRTDMAELPGITFATSDTRNLGPIIRRPNQVVYTDLTLSFIVSADLVEKYFFDYWMATIKDSSDLYSYYNDIVTDLELTLYTYQNEPVYGVRFQDAWPIAVNPIQLSWQDQDIMRLSVSFAYTRWEPLAYPIPPQTQPGGGSPSFLSDPAGASLGILNNFASSVLASSAAQLIQKGTSILGNRPTNKDPISQVVIPPNPIGIIGHVGTK